MQADSIFHLTMMTQIYMEMARKKTMTKTMRRKTMIEYLIYGAITLISLSAFIAISIAKAKIGWSFVEEEN